VSGVPERFQYRMELRRCVGQVVNGDAEMIEESHPASFADVSDAVESAKKTDHMTAR